MTGPSDTAPRGGHLLARLGARAVDAGLGARPRRPARFEGAADPAALAGGRREPVPADEIAARAVGEGRAVVARPAASRASAGGRERPAGGGAVPPERRAPADGGRGVAPGGAGETVTWGVPSRAAGEGPSDRPGNPAAAAARVAAAADRDDLAPRAPQPAAAAKAVPAGGSRAAAPVAEAGAAGRGTAPLAAADAPPARPAPRPFGEPLGTPAGLRPSSAHPDAAILRGAQGFRPPASSETASPPIRVTIGRIEIRAVRPEAPAPARRLAEPAVSLDRYLERRRSGR